MFRAYALVEMTDATGVNSLITGALQARRRRAPGREFATEYARLTERYGDAVDAGDEDLAERIDGELDALVAAARSKGHG